MLLFVARGNPTLRVITSLLRVLPRRIAAKALPRRVATPRRHCSRLATAKTWYQTEAYWCTVVALLGTMHGIFQSIGKLANEHFIANETWLLCTMHLIRCAFIGGMHTCMHIRWLSFVASLSLTSWWESPCYRSVELVVCYCAWPQRVVELGIISRERRPRHRRHGAKPDRERVRGKTSV